MESGIPVQFNIKRIAEEVTPEIEKVENDDELIAGLSNDKRWQALKARIESRMQAAQDSASVTQNTVGGMIDSMEEYGFKCALRDLLVEAYQNIINEVEVYAKILKDKKNESDQ